jgi:hypothetical protein
VPLINYPATAESFKGMILYNPGGPGSSGIESVKLSSPLYRGLPTFQITTLSLGILSDLDKASRPQIAHSRQTTRPPGDGRMKIMAQVLQIQFSKTGFSCPSKKVEIATKL